MKETKTIETIPASDLILDGVYFNNEHNLVKIKSIDEKNEEFHLFNISEQTNYYKVKFKRHNLVKRIR